MRKNLTFLFFFSLIVSNLSAQSLTVMSYNIHVGQDAANKDQLKNIAHLIKSSKADVVGLQEVDSVCNRSGNVDQMRYLAEYTGMHYAYARHFAFDGGSYGIGILSKYPLSEVKDHRIIVTSDGRSESTTRAFLTANILVGRKDIVMATVHMDFRDSNSRLRQAEAIVKLLGRIEKPVILTGDFNAVSGTKELVTIQSVFSDTGQENGLTYPASKPAKRIDFIMVNSTYLAKSKNPRVVDVNFSDHLPIMTEIKFNKAGL